MREVIINFDFISAKEIPNKFINARGCYILERKCNVTGKIFSYAGEGNFLERLFKHSKKNLDKFLRSHPDEWLISFIKIDDEDEIARVEHVLIWLLMEIRRDFEEIAGVQPSVSLSDKIYHLVLNQRKDGKSRMIEYLKQNEGEVCYHFQDKEGNELHEPLFIFANDNYSETIGSTSTKNDYKTATFNTYEEYISNFIESFKKNPI